MKRIEILPFLLLCLSLMIISVHNASATSPAVAVDPALTVANLGDTFNVNVNVTDIANFTSWQLNLYYLKAIVNCTNAVEGPFLQLGGGTYFQKTINNNYNSTHGSLLAYSTLLGITSVNGSGVILTVTFKAIGGGTTALTLANTQLGDEKIPPKPIPHVDVNGAVSVVGTSHDVAIVDISTSKTGCTPMPTVGQNLNVTIDVTIENHGGFDENTVDVAVYATPSAPPAILIGSKTVSLQILERATITFTYNMTMAYGNYTINATAGPVSGETNTGDNSLTDGKLLVTIQGDIDGDFKVGLQDLVRLALAYSSHPGNPKWNPNSDIDNNGVIGLTDLVLLALHYGQHFP
jgi:hypothetical protein